MVPFSRVSCLFGSATWPPISYETAKNFSLSASLRLEIAEEEGIKLREEFEAR